VIRELREGVGTSRKGKWEGGVNRRATILDFFLLRQLERNKYSRSSFVVLRIPMTPAGVFANEYRQECCISAQHLCHQYLPHSPYARAPQEELGGPEEQWGSEIENTH